MQKQLTAHHPVWHQIEREPAFCAAKLCASEPNHRKEHIEQPVGQQSQPQFADKTKVIRVHHPPETTHFWRPVLIRFSFHLIVVLLQNATFDVQNGSASGVKVVHWLIRVTRHIARILIQ